MEHPIFHLLLKIFSSILFLIITSALLTVSFIWLKSPGKPKPFKDSSGNTLENSISEKGYFKVNNANLGYVLKGKDKKKPILLYLHGGMPDYFLTETFPTGLDEIFTVIWLEQRGAGLSYQSRFQTDAGVLDTLVSDVVQVAKLSAKRFAKDKIYLMGHSGGTYLAVKVIERHPDLFKAYIGVAQIVYQKKSEKMAYDYVLSILKTNPQKLNVYQELLEHPVELDKPVPKEWLIHRDDVMHELGVGTMKSMEGVIGGLFIPSLLFSEYTLAEKINLWKGKARSGISIMWDEMLDHDLSIENTTFAIPFYIFHGISDLTCSYALSREYSDKIIAPRKGFFTFNESAHSPIFEEPGKSIAIIKEKILE